METPATTPEPPYYAAVDVSKDVAQKVKRLPLMSRRKRLLECEQSFLHSDQYEHEKIPDTKVCGYIEFKDTVEWQDAYRELKEVLAERENYGK